MVETMLYEIVGRIPHIYRRPLPEQHRDGITRKHIPHYWPFLDDTLRILESVDVGRTNLKISLQVEFMISTSMSHRNCRVTPLRLTNWGRNKMAAFQMTFWNGFSSMKIYEFRFKFNWILILGLLNNMPALVQIMTWCRLGDMPLSNQCRCFIYIYIYIYILCKYICVTLPQWGHIGKIFGNNKIARDYTLHWLC